jgi:putative glutamine amidotransferase
MSKPVIGLTSYVEPASWGPWTSVPAALVPDRYVAHIQAAGGIAVVVPPLRPEATEEDARQLLGRLDGLVLTGGSDVGASHYGHEPHLLAQQPRVERDSSELLLAQVARDLVPVLGICRGMQVMAVAAGGELEQHLPDRLGHQAHSPGPDSYGPQIVEPRPGSRLLELLGEQVEVGCHHHQGVASHPTYEVAALSTDGIIEAIESVEGPDAPFNVGVQWHPETGQDARLFEALVVAAARHLTR